MYINIAMNINIYSCEFIYTICVCDVCVCVCMWVWVSVNIWDMKDNASYHSISYGMQTHPHTRTLSRLSMYSLKATGCEETLVSGKKC